MCALYLGVRQAAPCQNAMLFQMREDSFLQEQDQLRLHQLIIVFDVKANQFLPGQVPFEFLGQLRAMPLFHDKNNVGPQELVGAQWAIGVGGQAG